MIRQKIKQVRLLKSVQSDHIIAYTVEPFVKIDRRKDEHNWNDSNSYQYSASNTYFSKILFL